MTISKLFIILGIAIFLIGLMLSFAPGLLNWFGKLPGDIRIENDKGFVYFPITSMLIVSIVLSLLLNLILKK